MTDASAAGEGTGLGPGTGSSGYAKKSYRKQLSDLQHAKPLTGSLVGGLFVGFVCLLVVFLVGCLDVVSTLNPNTSFNTNTSSQHQHTYQWRNIFAH